MGVVADAAAEREAADADTQAGAAGQQEVGRFGGDEEVVVEGRATAPRRPRRLVDLTELSAARSISKPVVVESPA